MHFLSLLLWDLNRDSKYCSMTGRRIILDLRTILITLFIITVINSFLFALAFHWFIEVTASEIISLAQILTIYIMITMASSLKIFLMVLLIRIFFSPMVLTYLALLLLFKGLLLKINFMVILVVTVVLTSLGWMMTLFSLFNLILRLRYLIFLLLVN